MILTHLHRIFLTNFVLQQFCKKHGYRITEPCLVSFGSLDRLASSKSPNNEEILAFVKELGYRYSQRLIRTHLKKLLQQGLIKKDGKQRYTVTKEGQAALQEMDRMLENPAIE